MRLIMPMAALAGALALSACAVPPPTGPEIMAWPGKGKDFNAFQQDDAACQAFARQSIGNGSPSTAAANSAVSSALIGTLVGAGAGAGLGAAAGNPVLGAAAGAGAGLLVGSATGLGAAQVSGAQLQQRYDMRYAQCMASKGNRVPGMEPASAEAPMVATGPVVTPVFSQVSPPTSKPMAVTPVTPAAPAQPAQPQNLVTPAK